MTTFFAAGRSARPASFSGTGREMGSVGVRRLGRVVSTTIAAVLVLETAAAPLAYADGAAPPQQTVEQLAAQAYEQTSTGKFSDAIMTYMKAYEISHAAAVLYNIAAIYDRKLHERSLAMEYFRRYLQAPDADPEFARKATERLSALKVEATAEEQQRSSMKVANLPPPPTPAPSPPPPEEKHGNGLFIAGFVVGGLGVIGAATGLVFGSLAQSKHSDANKYCSATSCSSPTGVSLDNDSNTFATLSTAFVIGGAALVAAGVTFVIVGAPHGKSSSSAMLTLAPQASTTGGGLTLQGRF